MNNSKLKIEEIQINIYVVKYFINKLGFNIFCLQKVTYFRAHGSYS